jgi:hypothetical protein
MKLIKSNISTVLWTICKQFHVLPNDPLLQNLNIFQANWIMLNMQSDAEMMQKEMDKVSGKKGQTVRAQTNDADFDAMIKENIARLKNKNK